MLRAKSSALLPAKKRRRMLARTNGKKDEAEEHIPAKAGLNQFTWDLRYESPKKIPAAVYDEGEPSGPLVLPGNYRARLTVGAKNFTAPLGVIMDPRVKTSAEDLRKQFDLLLKCATARTR